MAGFGRLLHSNKSSNTAGDLSGSNPTSGASTNAPTPAVTPTKSAQPTTASAPRGTKIGPASAVPVKGAATFQDPASGDPAVVVQPQAGAFVAFDAVCPHAGCTVDYEPGHRVFFCPCHGSQFNGSTGAVEVGPASSGLRKIKIAAGPDGQLYVT